MIPTHEIFTDKNAVGALIVSISTKRALLNLRAAHKTHPVCWSLWGGMMEAGETPKDALLREMVEEMGVQPNVVKINPFDVYQSNDGHFKYFSFVCLVEDEFTPVLNYESCGYCWVNLGVWPRPMHHGAKISFDNHDSLSKLEDILAEYHRLITQA